MRKKDKFVSLCKAYRVYVDNIHNDYLDELVVGRIMLKAYEQHKTEISFENFVRNCLAEPVEYLYGLATKLDREFYELHLVNNCFNDGGAVHYGLKVERDWYFISHRKNNFSLPLLQEEFLIKPKDLVGTSYLTSRANVAPNVLKWNVGSIKRSVIKQYDQKYLGK